MGLQDRNISRNSFENKVLDLEKKYFNLIFGVLTSKSFKDDLLLIEKEIRENYSDYDEIWDPKNKIKVPAERLVRHHLYTQLHNQIEEIFPSPVSSDFGVKTEDCILCVDVKTIDIIGNAGDLKSTHVEANQNSFDNRNYPGVKYESHLNSIEHYSRKPVLTYVVKIIYRDDNYSFSLCRSKYPTIVLACVPNGELSRLFDFNIIDNFKTYEYYKESEGPYFKYIFLPSNFSGLSSADKKAVCDSICLPKGFVDLSSTLGKIAYYDPAKLITWWITTESKKVCLKPVKGGASVRFNNEMLEKRYDSRNLPWEGYVTYTIFEELA